MSAPRYLLGVFEYFMYKCCSSEPSSPEGTNYLDVFALSRSVVGVGLF